MPKEKKSTIKVFQPNTFFYSGSMPPTPKSMSRELSTWLVCIKGKHAKTHCYYRPVRRTYIRLSIKGITKGDRAELNVPTTVEATSPILWIEAQIVGREVRSPCFWCISKHIFRRRQIYL
jgi:hypothetical protein